jgi:thiamine biosynthesis protein ThiS
LEKKISFCAFCAFLWQINFMRVYVNGESKDLSSASSLADLIAELELPATRIAIELNREVVRRNEWSGTMLHEDDRVEIVHFVGGGVD